MSVMGLTEVFRHAMSKAAARLRAQKAYSTDPEYLERMAVEEEARERHTLRSRGDELGVISVTTPTDKPQ